jgi:hypothetical protein
MKIIKTFTAIKIGEYKKETSSFSHDLKPNLSFGNESEISGGVIRTQFNTEEEAIKYAHESDEYGQWLILPKITFDND